jgi:hypothetical protein
MHIYLISRLHGKTPTTWERTLRELEKARSVMLAQYAPLRHAILQEVTHTGSGQQVLDRGLAGMSTKPGQQTVVRKSQDAFDVFCVLVKPRVKSLVEDYLRPSYAPAPVQFAGEDLEGRFHAAIDDEEGTRRHVYLHAASWTEEEVIAFVELLSIVAEQRHGSAREAVWFVDLTRGRIVYPPKNYKRLRQGLGKTVALLGRLTKAAQQQF